MVFEQRLDQKEFMFLDATLISLDIVSVWNAHACYNLMDYYGHWEVFFSVIEL